jgi:Ca-activated chloride channel family protein
MPSDFRDDDLLPTTDHLEPEPDNAVEGVLSLDVRSEWTTLAPGKPVFALLTVQARATMELETASSPPRRAMDLVLVLDVSSSMQGNSKLEELKRAVLFVATEQASERDRISVVTFNQEAKRPQRLRCMTKEGRSELATSVHRLVADGGTNIAAGLALGLEVLEQRRSRNEVAALLLLTDGQDRMLRNAIGPLVRRCEALGASLYCFAVGADHDASLLQFLSEITRTPYTFLENAESQTTAFAGLVGGLSSVVAKSVDLRVALGAELLAVHTPFEQRREGDVLNIRIPDVFAEERRDVLLELRAPEKSSGETTLLEASLRYRDLQQGAGVSFPPQMLVVQLSDDVQPEGEPEDEEVSEQRARVEVTRALVEAANLQDLGAQEEAQIVLRAQEARVARRDTALSRMLTTELQSAMVRMQDLHRWKTTGRAEHFDVAQTQALQRCTTTGTPSRDAYCREAQRFSSAPSANMM